MQKFSVKAGEAEKIHQQIFKAEDSQWKMLVEREEHDISPGYDLGKKHNRLSLYRTLRALEGRDYKAALGGGTTLNNVGVNEWRPDTCGCIVVFLYRKDLKGPWAGTMDYAIGDIVVHGGKSWIAKEPIDFVDVGSKSTFEVPGESESWELHADTEIVRKEVAHHSDRVCGSHMDCAPHSQGHYDEVLECCTHKNVCVGEAAEALGVDPREIRVRYRRENGERVLYLVHDKAEDSFKRGAAELRISNNQHGNKRPVRITS